jgi:hypothetical protein
MNSQRVQKRLFISVFNSGSLRLALNHLASICHVGIDNYLAFALDENAAAETASAGYKVILARSSDFDSQACDFGSQEFNRISYLRYPVISALLKTGVNVWYLDVDTVCLKNLNSDFDSFIQSDNLMTLQSDLNMLCTGCMVFRAAPECIDHLNQVFSRSNTERNDQLCFNELLSRNLIIQPRVGVLPSLSYPCGQLYFDPPYIQLREQYASLRNKLLRSSVSLVHANWMIGNARKEEALRSTKLWFLD